MNNRIALLISIPILIFFLGCNYKQDPGYDIFKVRFTNNSTSAIQDIYLQMNGSEDVIQITGIAIGQTSDYHTFILPHYEGQIPQSWGDYFGEYTQKTEPKSIFILNYDHKFRSEITILINNSDYTFVSP